ncbi:MULTISPECIES: YezD family protein [unclassified Butyrivibrio]|jgi:hypothetical protein|nr:MULTISPECIES: YezD family protein [unclassified Butyrivibrio]MCR5343685.1 YezD family protein [Butyrivibrio sp.]
MEKDDEKIWEEIKKQVSEVKYGTVLITVHDGRIVQLEKSTKVRF